MPMAFLAQFCFGSQGGQNRREMAVWEVQAEATCGMGGKVFVNYRISEIAYFGAGVSVTGKT